VEKLRGRAGQKVWAVAPRPRPRTTTVKNRKLVTALGFNVPLAVADTEGESGGMAPLEAHIGPTLPLHKSVESKAAKTRF